MSTNPAWIVYAWPRILCAVEALSGLQFAHLSTQVLVAGAGRRPSTGQTLWLSRSGESAAGVAWDWVSQPPGVVALADPMSLVSNIQLLNDEGEVLAPFELALELNGVVHGLPWQDQVQRALSAAGQGTGSMAALRAPA